MGYVTNSLMTGERIVHLGKVHWFVFVPGVVMFLFYIGLALLLSAAEPGRQPSAVFLFAPVVFVFAIVSLIRALIYKISTELAVTSKRVIAKVGFISRNTVELNHSKVESFRVDQSILGRIVGFGTVVIRGTGGGKTLIRNISDPLEFRRQAVNIVDETSESVVRVDA